MNLFGLAFLFNSRIRNLAHKRGNKDARIYTGLILSNQNI